VRGKIGDRGRIMERGDEKRRRRKEIELVRKKEIGRE
jgi:hypothetical protein